MSHELPQSLYTDIFKTGSSVICNPPVTTTDEDWMFLTKDMVEGTTYLIENDWVICGEEYSDKRGVNWLALRKDKLNYLLTDDEVYFEKFLEATEIATKLNLLNKSDRITLFNLVLRDFR
mgnify:CR=1 FL=1